MKIVGIETSGSIGSVAVCDGNTVVGGQTFGKTSPPGPTRPNDARPAMPFGRVVGQIRAGNHGKEIVSSLEAVFNEVKWKPEDIDLIAVSVGPGSYTGLRIGVTCAKTLAYGLGKPVIGVPTLDVLAANIKDDVKHLCPVIDAKRKRVYACVYDRNNRKNKRITDFLIITPEELIDILPESTLIFGDGVAPYKDIFAQKKVTIIDNEKMGIADAVNVARLGLERYEQGERCEINSLVPLYLRKSEAEEKLEEHR